MLLLSANTSPENFEPHVFPSSKLPELARANAHDMTGPAEILQLRNPADKKRDTFIVFETNVSGTFYAAFLPADTDLSMMSLPAAGSAGYLHSHEYYEFMFVIEGEIYQNIEHNRHYYPAGGCCLVNPYVLHTEEYDTECRVLFFKVSREFMDEILNFPRYFPQENNTACKRLREYLDSGRNYIDFIPANGYEWIKDNVHRIFEKIIYELASPSDSATLKLALCTSRLLTELFDDVMFSNTPAVSGTPREQELFYRIREYMLSSDRKVTRSDLENHFNYSGDSIYRVVRHYTGLSINDYGSYICIRKAAGLLTSGSLNINEIAESVGFHNFTQFYKEFKKYYHMTPREYRSSHPASKTR